MVLTREDSQQLVRLRLASKWLRLSGVDIVVGISVLGSCLDCMLQLSCCRGHDMFRLIGEFSQETPQGEAEDRSVLIGSTKQDSDSWRWL